MTSRLETSSAAKAAGTINLLAGIWFFVSPWVYGAYTSESSLNGWIVGAALVILAAIRLASPPLMSWISWVNCALGVWIFFSPWIFSYTGNTGRFVNSLVVGAIVFFVAIAGAKAMPRMHEPTPHSM
ncbi:MAG: SPW repeat protein [Acidobacteriota bacterium]|nr:SPW repeat protein [Acidobacteriota bacterium]